MERTTKLQKITKDSLKLLANESKFILKLKSDVELCKYLNISNSTLVSYYKKELISPHILEKLLKIVNKEEGPILQDKAQLNQYTTEELLKELKQRGYINIHLSM